MPANNTLLATEQSTGPYCTTTGDQSLRLIFAMIVFCKMVMMF